MIDLQSGFDFLGRLMDASALRAKVIAHNIANQNTPGFRCREVRFEEQLRRFLAEGGLGGGEAPLAEVVESEGGQVKPDGNNVNLEDEVALNTKNSLYYGVMSEAARWRFSLYRDAMQER